MVTNERNNSLFFNSKIKNKYLDEMVADGILSEETAKSYARIFSITKNDEKALKKDLNKFTLKELETILYNFKANNRNTIESYARIISSYLNWSVQNGFTNKNPLADLKPADFEKYLANEEHYFTEKQLRRYEEQCVNYQDAVILRLLFEGVGGKQLSEIRNLKKQDVDFKNKRLRLVNTLKADKSGLPEKYTERWIDVDNHTLDLIEGAINKKIYVKRNGEMEERDNIRSFTDLVDNDYVVRASITRTENWDTPVDKYVIYRRVQLISEILGIEHMTTKFIQRSGMIYYANKLINDDKLSLDDIKIVADRFNIKSYHNLKGFVTVENIRKTYPKE